MLVLASGAVAEPLAAPGDMRLRHDLQLLNDAGVINIPLTAWPVSLGDVNNAIDGVDGASLNKSNLLALSRVTQRLSWELDVDSLDFVFGVSGSSEPRVIRTFENTPRAEGEASAKLAWVGERFAFNLSATLRTARGKIHHLVRISVRSTAIFPLPHQVIDTIIRSVLFYCA